MDEPAMNQLPFFIEVLESKESAPSQICRKIMATLFRQKIAPLPFAGSLQEIRAVLGSLRTRNTPPAIYIVNTYWAEELLPEIDKLMAQTPVLFFRRNLFVGGGSAAELGGPPVSDKTSQALKMMTPRLTTVLDYGTKTADVMAQKCGDAIVQFLRDGNYDHISRLTAHQADTFKKAMDSAQEKLAEFRLAFDAPPVAASLSGSQASAVGAADRGIHGNLEQMGLSTLLLMIDMEKKSGELLLARNNESARLYVGKGRVLAAYVEGPVAPPESRMGAEAVFYALTWTAGRFDFVQRPVEMEDKVKAQTNMLLMEGARRMDEASGKTNE